MNLYGGAFHQATSKLGLTLKTSLWYGKNWSEGLAFFGHKLEFFAENPRKDEENNQHD
jgi:hypothetical protein